VNVRQSMSVMRVAFTKILSSASTASSQLPSNTPSSSLVEDKIEFDWLGDYIPYQSETKLSDDAQELRMLEAELYTLNDQSNTELGNDNPLVS